MSSVNSEILEAAATLRSKAVLKTPFVKKSSPKLRKTLLESTRKRLEAAARPDGIVDFIRRGSQVTAVLTLHSDSESIPGLTFPDLNIDFNNTPAGKRDARELLLRHRRKLKKDTVCFALASMPAVRNLLRPLGFGTEYAVLLGPVSEGLNSLIQHFDPPTDLDHLGLKIKMISSTKQLDTVMDIFRKEFGRNPQYGRWVGEAAYLTQIRKNMRAALKKKNLDGFLICRGKSILGYFGYYKTPSGPMYPSIAGVEIILDQEIQGLGIVKTCYRLMLEDLRRQRVALIRGGTSQPAVIGLGKILKRKPFAYMMILGSKYFSEEHFGLRK